MNVKREKLSETKVKLNIAIDELEIVPIKEKVLRKLSQNMKIAGFRKGKAPLSVIEKQADNNLLQTEVLQEAIQQNYGTAVEKEGLNTLTPPEIKVEAYVPFTEIKFTAEVEIMPKVKLGDYDKIKKKPAKVTVSEKEVSEVVENLRTRAAEKVESKQAANNGDEVIIDFEGKDSKGKAVSGASGKDYPLTLGTNTFIPGFEDGVVGLKTGDKKTLNLTFPKDYHAKNLAGTKIKFDVEVKKVQELKKPEANDDFASKAGPFKSIKELKEDIRTQLTRQKEIDETNKIKDEIVEELVKKSTFAMPEILVDDQIKMLEQDMAQNLMYRGITKSEYIKERGFKDEDDWKKQELVPQAERRVAVGIVLSAVADKESLQVSQQELDERLNLYRQQYQQQQAEFDKPEVQRDVASRVLTEKTVQLLFEKATK